MSYCRWSSVCEDNFDSDVYVYDHVGGYIAVHVAEGRKEGVQNAPRVKGDPLAQYMARRQWLAENSDKLRLVFIDLPYAGTDHQFDNAEDCVAFLSKLKALGYHMPNSVLDVATYQDV